MGKPAGIASFAAEAQEARERMGMTIDRIHARVSPERLIDDATEIASAKLAAGVETTRRKLQRHPLAVGFIGAMAGLYAARRLRS